ncbi:MAG: hypothetical protein E6K10_01190 [Methanobacteriota archaeon]|nr:MAG: hypothetical protein E6K10_01190 [Euryarchaeota archaeon]
MANRIWIELPRDAYYTGEVVSGTVALQVDKPVDARGLALDVFGREETVITRQRGKQSVTYRSRADLLAWQVPLHGPGVVPPGLQRFPFQFQIPVYALPSYTGTHATVSYGVNARLDVPWWPDARASQAVYVYFARESVRTFSKPVRFWSGGAPDGPQVYVELDGDRFFARELIGCRITILRLGEHRVRRVYVRLVGGEWARAQNAEETTTSKVADLEIPMGTIKVGEPFTFEIPLPAEIQSSYRGTYSYFSYILQIGLDIAWATDLVAETPVVIVR